MTLYRRRRIRLEEGVCSRDFQHSARNDGVFQFPSHPYLRVEPLSTSATSVTENVGEHSVSQTTPAPLSQRPWGYRKLSPLEAAVVQWPVAAGARLPRGAEAVQRAARPHVDPSITQRGRGTDLVADFVDGEHLPLRSRFENGDLAFGIREEHLPVRGHG